MIHLPFNIEASENNPNLIFKKAILTLQRQVSGFLSKHCGEKSKVGKGY